MTRALMIWGMALMSEITAILRPSLREIMRRGRRTRSIRMTLMKSMFRLLKMIEISYLILVRDAQLEAAGSKRRKDLQKRPL